MELESGKETRITPPGIDVFTPATCKGRDWIAVASPDKDGYRCTLYMSLQLLICIFSPPQNGSW